MSDNAVAQTDPAEARRFVGPAFRTWTWAWRRVWTDSRGFTIALAVLTALRGSLPAATALVLRGLINGVVDLSGGGGALDQLFPWLAGFFGLAIVEALSRFANQYVTLRLSDDLHVSVNSELIDHASRLDLEFFEDPGGRDLIQRATAGAGRRLARLVIESQNAITNLIQMVTLLGVLVAIEPLVIVVLPPFGIPLLVFQWRLAKRRYGEEHNRATKRRWTSYYLGLVTGAYSAAEVRLLDLGPLLKDRFEELIGGFRDRDRFFHRKNLTGSSLAALLTLGGLYALLARVALQAVAGAATVGDLAIFAGGAGRLRVSLEQTIHSASVGYEQTLFVSNIRDFLSAKSALEDGTLVPSDDHAARVSIQNVTFSYPGAPRPVLNDVTLEIEPGETIAIVGENGAGKTTLAKLLTRLYDPDDGAILFNSVDVREYKLAELHRRIACVFQPFAQYEATAADNIAFGDWRLLLDRRDRIETIARAAGVYDFVQDLEDGFDTPLGRRFSAVTLSGGEWQRLALARAAARGASLLILDEPTSSMDARAQSDLFDRFEQLAAGRTAILISHRFTTIGMANRIVVLADGRVAEVGTHDELLAASGAYAALYALHDRLLL